MIEGLGRPENAIILAQLRTARAWGVPLSTIRHGNPPNDWGRFTDRHAALALTLHEQGLHDCGHPRSRAMHPEMDGWYEVTAEHVCYACRTWEQWRTENQDAEPGTVAWVVDTRDDRIHGPLPPFRI